MKQVFNYWKEFEDYRTQLYEDGEMNLSDDDDDIAVEHIEENTLPMDDMIEQAKLNGYKNVKFEYDADGIYVSNSLPVNLVNELKEFFTQIWRID